MRFYIGLAVIFLILVAGFSLLVPRGRPTRQLHGYVMIGNEPVEGATVGFQGHIIRVLSESDGAFELPILSHNPSRITAAKEGFFIGSAFAEADPLIVRLSRLPSKDNENYAWVEPTPDPARSRNCGNCHREIYDEWSASGHARSASDRRFLNLYDGSDWHGRPHVGWSLRDEHPEGTGVCNACHAPTAAFDTDLKTLSGPAAQGVHCDFCHKIAKANTERVGLTHGRYGLDLLRPPHPSPSPPGGVPQGTGRMRGPSRGQIFFGPLDDVDRGEDSYSPLYQESRYCASCHEGVIFGVPVYTTYSEWLESPARKQGKQCQSCHMAPTGKMSNIAPGKGGIERDPRSLGNHRFFAPSQADMLQQCLHLSTKTMSSADFLDVTVKIRTEQVGHRVPTGFVDRNLLLVVEALEDGKSILPSQGPKIPSFADQEWAGGAGKVYAKRLTDFEGKTPVPFWRAKPDVQDTRLIPDQVDSVRWRFPAGADHLRIRLIYRRFWPETAKAKGWPPDDIIVLDKEIRP